MNVNYRVWSQEHNAWLTDDENWSIALSPDGQLWVCFDNDDWIQRDDLNICFSTGREDKNGVQIYEGDLITDIDYPDGAVYEVKWNEEYTAFCPTWHGEKIGWRGEDFKVVGNIYENGDLVI